MDKFHEQPGALMLRARISARIAQAEIARRLGVPRSTIWSWETGVHEPSAGALHAYLVEVGAEHDTTISAAWAARRQDDHT